jgi:hypothetical protein
MTKKTRRKIDATLKAKIALEAVREYRTPAPASEDDLALMRRIDELFTTWPFLGSRRGR